MINFVICEEDTSYITAYKKYIDKIMMNFDIEYDYHIFHGYTAKWKEFTSQEAGFKVYIMAIKTKEGSGLEAAQYIREQLDDWQSMIIMISVYIDYKYEALSKRLMLVDYISKFDNIETRLGDAIKICLKNYDKRPKTLKFTFKKIIYNIEFSKILYIEKEQDNKRCICKTTEGNYYIAGTLATVSKMLDHRFIQICRSIIINGEQIESYNVKSNIITFKNKEELNAISRNKKKEIINYIRGIYHR